MTVKASGPMTGVTRDDGRGVKNQDDRQQDVTSRPSGWTTVVTRHDGPPVVYFLKTVVDLLKLLCEGEKNHKKGGGVELCFWKLLL